MINGLGKSSNVDIHVPYVIFIYFIYFFDV